MGEVYKPENFAKKKKSPIRDIKPEFPAPSIPPNVKALTQEIERLKHEIEKIKRALRIQGIQID
jgi:hypothetical protein